MNFSILKKEAKTSLEGNWQTAIVAILITFLPFIVLDYLLGIKSDEGGFFAWIAHLMLQAPIHLGLVGVYLKLSRKGDTSAREVFEGFNNWWKSFLLALLQCIYIVLWSILLIVPGLIAALSYSMSFFILADNPEINSSEALRRSKLMMRGHKTEFFMLNLSFIGWFILSVLSFGVLFIVYVGPYYYATITEFYETLQEISDY